MELKILIEFTCIKVNSRILRSSTNIKNIKKESSVNKLEKTIAVCILYKKKEKAFKHSLTSMLEKHIRVGWMITSCRLYNEVIFPNYFFITKFLDHKIYEESILNIVDIITFAIRPNAKEYFKNSKVEPQNVNYSLS